MSRRCHGEDGQAGGIEVLPFGLLVFVAGVLVIVNAWGVVDAKTAVAAAAREATRAYVEAADGDAAPDAARRAAEEAMTGAGRDPARLTLTRTGGGYERCARVTYEARYRVPAIRVPWIGGFGSGLTAAARHSEVIDPLRSGLGGKAACGGSA